MTSDPEDLEMSNPSRHDAPTPDESMPEKSMADASSSAESSNELITGATAELPQELLVELEQIACDLAVAAGRLIVDERPEGLGVAATKSSDTDVVTVMDQRSEAFLHQRLAELRPDDGLMGEEGASSPGTSGITWVVDPIDGTVNYLYEIPAYAVSIAACVGDVTTVGAWRTVAGAVYNPVTDELFHARSGGGAILRRGERVHRLAVSSERELGHALTGTGFGYDSANRKRQGDVVAQIVGQVRDLRRIGSAALDLCFVGAGRLDVYYESGLNPWDQAAGQLVVTEAGGVVQGRGSDAPNKDLVVAGPVLLVDALKALLNT